MDIVTRLLRKLVRSTDRGASLVEYALLIGLIAMICFAAMGFVGESTSTGLSDAGQSLANGGG